MREARLEEWFKDVNFGCIDTREMFVEHKEFVYGHYQIGYDSHKNFFGREQNTKRGFATVGGIRVGDRFYYAVALCSPNDNFSKSFGRYLVKNHMLDESDSSKRGVVNITHLKDEQPAVVLKYVVELHLQKARRLPAWTKQQVLFRGSRNVSHDRVLDTPISYNITKKDIPKNGTSITKYLVTKVECDSSLSMFGGCVDKRSLAAYKAWDTRRKNIK